MPTRPPRPTYHPWRDAEGTPIPPQLRVEQIPVNKEHGAPPTRIHKQGHVIGRGPHWLYARFDNQVISLRARLMRLLTTPSDNSQRESDPFPTRTTSDDDLPWLD